MPHPGHDRARLKWDKEGSSYSLPIGRLNCYIKALRAQKVCYKPNLHLKRKDIMALTASFDLDFESPLIPMMTSMHGGQSLQDEILRAKPHSIIKLKGAVWHGNSSHNMDTLYVREAFPALIRARNLRIQALGWSESGCETVFSGSSGTCHHGLSSSVSEGSQRDSACKLIPRYRPMS